MVNGLCLKNAKSGVVKDAAVFGKPEPSVQELVTACVVRKEGALVNFDFDSTIANCLNNCLHCQLSVALIFFEQVTTDDLQMLVDNKVSVSGF